MGPKKNISVVFPAFNEEESMEETIHRSLEALRSMFEEFEILIIDDASTDETDRIADALAAEHREIRVIHNATTMRQGASILVGFQSAKHDLVIHNAMDYPFDLRDLNKMLPLLEDGDIIVAARTRRVGYSLYRVLLSAVNVTLLNILFGLRLRDYNFTQLYRKSVLNEIKVDTRSTAFLTPEIIIRAYDKGYRIKEVEIDYYPREKGVAKSGSLDVVLPSLRDLLRFWIKRARERHGTESLTEHSGSM